MRLREFIELIPKDGWTVDWCGQLRRRVLRGGEDLSFRKLGVNYEPSYPTCPIVSAFDPEKGYNTEFLEIATKHGMAPELARNIVSAADNRCSTPTHRRLRRVLVSYLINKKEHEPVDKSLVPKIE